MYPVRVYLDSSDYSDLSNPRKQTTETIAIRSRLQQWASSGAVEFWYSAAHITEMAPLDAKYADAAEARAGVLVSLCSTNALISFDRLFLAELRGLESRSGPPSDVYSKTGDWFPEISDVISPVSRLDYAKVVQGASQELGLNRQSRRHLKTHLLRAGQPRAGSRKAFADLRDSATLLEEMLANYPMRPEDAEILRDYFFGKASAQQAETAFLHCLRDPRWMMQWFTLHSDALTPIIEWARGPARSMAVKLAAIGETVNASFERAAQLRDRARELGLDERLFAAHPFTEAQRAQEQFVSSTAKTLAEKMLTCQLTNLKAAEVDQYSPGLATCLRTHHTLAWHSIGEMPRKLKDSDFVDVLHSMYAPYVDVYRADAYMAPIIKRAVGAHTVVVPKLSELVAIVDAQLGAQGNTLGPF